MKGIHWVRPTGSVLAAGLLVGWIALIGQAANVIVDHTNWDWILSQPLAVSNTIAAQKVFFAHASVGGNVMSGLLDLHGSDASRFPLVQSSDDGIPPTTTLNGRVYDNNRGNPSWQDKVSNFSTDISNGWHAPTVDFTMNKFCYIDQEADWATYRDAMTVLESAYPSTKFIYWTMPLMTSNDADQVKRAQFNTALRNWLATQNGKLLFDIADMEAWNASGVQQTFVYNGTSYARMESAYSSDGGHLNQTGYDRVATGFYSLLGLALTTSDSAPILTPTPTTGARTPTSTPGVIPVRAYPNPAKDAVTFDVPTEGNGSIEIQIYNSTGDRVGLVRAEAGTGLSTSVRWMCADLAPGVYWAKIKRAGKPITSLKFAIRR